MAQEVFCWLSIMPFRAQRIDHDKFNDFLTSSTDGYIAAMRTSECPANPSYVIRVFRKMKYFTLESKRYFTPIVADDRTIAFLSEH